MLSLPTKVVVAIVVGVVVEKGVAQNIADLHIMTSTGHRALLGEKNTQFNTDMLSLVHSYHSAHYYKTSFANRTRFQRLELL